MRVITRTGLLMLWIGLAGAAAGTRDLSGVDRPDAIESQCYFVNGEWYCPCAGTLATCEPPDCMLIEGEWYCREG
jgi:hypothetical protein